MQGLTYQVLKGKDGCLFLAYRFLSTMKSLLLSLGSLLVLSLVFFIAEAVCPALAETTKATEVKTRELKTINQQIQNLQQGLSQAQNKQVTLQKELQKRNAAIEQHSHQLQTLDKQIAKQNADIKTLQQKETLTAQEVEQHQDTLELQLRNMYVQGRRPYLKLLLSQDDSAAVNRALVYCSYLTKARLDLITHLHQGITQLEATQQRLQQRGANLKSQRAEHQQERSELLASKQEKQQVLGQVQADIKKRGQKLAQLLAEKKALEQIINRLRKAQSTFIQPHSPFAQLYGKLLWPVQGPVLRQFGTQLSEGELKYTGILIGAPEGSEVRAIYPGRVIFANRLQGFGLLLIIDHGNGYMSLYGYNHSLYKKTKDIVAAGDVIASTGDNGSRDSTGLYFEIRQNGHPLDPLSWLSNKK